MSNTVAIVTAVAQGAVIGFAAINWTTVLTVITVSLTLMATLIKIFGSAKQVNDEDLRQSNYLKGLEAHDKEIAEKLIIHDKEIAEKLLLVNKEIAEKLENKNKEIAEKLENKNKEDNVKSDNIKECITTLKTDIEKMKVEQSHNSKSLDELRRDNRELVQRLDDLLKKLIEWID